MKVRLESPMQRRVRSVAQGLAAGISTNAEFEPDCCQQD